MKFYSRYSSSFLPLATTFSLLLAPILVLRVSAADRAESELNSVPAQTNLANPVQPQPGVPTSLLPAPWKDGEEMRLEIKFPTGYRIGAAFYSVEAGELNGRKIWQLNSRTFAGAQGFSRVQVDAASFEPIQSRWRHSLIGEVETDYKPGRALLKSKGKEDKPVELRGVVYDNEELIQFLRCLPLTNGYSTNVRLFSSLAGGAILPVRIHVAKEERVTVSAGAFDCFKLESSIRQTFWYSTDSQRLLVKYEQGEVVGELQQLLERKGAQPEKHAEPALDFSVVVPPNWRMFRADNSDHTNKTVLILLDPEAAADSSLQVQSQASLKAESRRSLRSWAETELKTATHPLQVRPDSWKERMVSGHRALSVMADYTEGKEKKVAYAVFTFGVTNAASFKLELPASEFDRLRPQFEAILDGYKTK